MLVRFDRFDRSWRGLRLPAVAVVGVSVVFGFVGSAGAAVYTPIDGPSLAADLAAANASPPPNTIVLADTGENYLPTTPLVISQSGLTITGLHNDQQQDGGPVLDGSAELNPDADFVVVDPGVSATFEGFTVTGATDSNASYAAIRDDGTLELDNVELSGSNGPQLSLTSPGKATIINSGISDGLSAGLVVPAGASATLINSTVSNNGIDGIQPSSTGSNVTLDNTVVAYNAPKNCVKKLTTAGDDSLDSDGSCGVKYSDLDPLLGPTLDNNGPTPSELPGAGSPVIGAGDPAICPATDQRFFVRGTGCDIGSVQVNATQDTTPPVCAVTSTNYPGVNGFSGTAAQQTVTGTDPGGSGFGNAGASDADAAGGADATFNNGAFSDISISNGSFVAPALPDPAAFVPLSITATKANQTQSTKWSFYLTDWAGLTTYCH